MAAVAACALFYEIKIKGRSAVGLYVNRPSAEPETPVSDGAETSGKPELSPETEAAKEEHAEEAAASQEAETSAKKAAGTLPPEGENSHGHST